MASLSVSRELIRPFKEIMRPILIVFVIVLFGFLRFICLGLILFYTSVRHVLQVLRYFYQIESLKPDIFSSYKIVILVIGLCLELLSELVY